MADILEYKCPCCGGAIEFNSDIQKMKCPYCDTEFEMETLKKYDEQLNEGSKDEMDWQSTAGSEWKEGEDEGLHTYICKSCGGEIVGDENTAAMSCPFCDNPVVMMGQFSGELRPDYVIPFKLDKKAAKEGLMKHLKGKKLLPKIFKSENHIDEVRGVYVPFWLYDADVDGRVNYAATRVRHWSDSNYNYTETSHYNVFRKGRLSFNNIPVDGSTKMDDDLMESIEPFDFREAVDFQTAYLAGYVADKYDVGVKQSQDRANNRVRVSTEEAFRSTVHGYATVTPKNSSIHLNDGEAKYALYPVWILNTTWNGNKYTFAMNGQTGKFVGDLPMDKGAAFKWWGASAAIIGIISFIIANLVL